MGQNPQRPPRSRHEQQELQERFHRGDLDAFRLLVEPHLDTLYTLCLRIVGGHAQADDLSQEALLRALNKHQRYNPQRPFRPWLLTIATNLCRDRIRAVWWRRVLPFSKPHQAAAPSPELISQNVQQDELVRQALARLPARYCEALSLFYLDDMNYQEMSVITGVSVSALKQRVRRGKVMLRAELKELYPDTTPET